MDRKMTDDEIIKALECCAENNCTYDCPFYQNSCIKCKYSSSEIIKFAFDLINLKNAEIERLRKETSQTIESIRKLARDTIRDTKSEAVKEFAKRLKTEFEPETNYGVVANFTIKLFRNTIDNLIKEMEMTEQTTFEKIEHNSLCETETYKGGE